MRRANSTCRAWAKIVLTLLDWRWSPQQIAGTLKRAFPNEPERHVSHETIYNAIYAQPRGELRRQLVACLRRGHSTRMPAPGAMIAVARSRTWSASMCARPR